MKIEFYWYPAFGKLEPACRFDERDTDCIVNLLSDNCGFGYMSAISQVNETLDKILQIQSGIIDDYIWFRECWAASLCINKARILFIGDESYYQDLKLENFVAILKEWVVFLKGIPDSSNHYTFEV